MVPIIRLHHAGFRVFDGEPAVAFYGKLGFRVEYADKTDPVYVLSTASGVEINLIVNANARGGGPNILMDETEKYPGITLFLTDLEWMLLPPLRLGQFRLIRNKGLPMAFASWAFVDTEVSSRLQSGQMRLRPTDWNNGKECWIIDLVAPRGGQDDVLNLLHCPSQPPVPSVAARSGHRENLRGDDDGFQCRCGRTNLMDKKIIWEEAKNIKPIHYLPTVVFLFAVADLIVFHLVMVADFIYKSIFELSSDSIVFFGKRVLGLWVLNLIFNFPLTGLMIYLPFYLLKTQKIKKTILLTDLLINLWCVVAVSWWILLYYIIINIP